MATRTRNETAVVKVSQGAAKKAAKKPSKKAAKKVAKKAAKKTARSREQDLRRAYEHLQRVRILHKGVRGEPLGQLDTLTRLAERTLRDGDAKSTAHLLRAAEHMAFGSLADARAERGVEESVVQAAHAEYGDLRERAQFHWETRTAPRGVAGVYRAMLAEAQAAMRTGALHRGLELARGAEALTHVQGGADQMLEGGRGAKRLRA